MDVNLDEIKRSGGYEWTPGSPWPPYAGVGNTPLDMSVGAGNTATEPVHSPYYYDYNRNDPDRENPFTDPQDREMAERVVGKAAPWIYESPDGGKTVYRHVRGRDPSTRERVILEEDSSPKKELSINKSEYKKYEEDKGIKDLQDYVTSTYNGHYTSKGSNVQTLDLIESVGDAESFCRSNAIKYLSRYDKKGQAKRDILKAMHYCLLLYYFSGQTNETETSGYETF